MTLHPQPPNTWVYYAQNGSMCTNVYVPIGYSAYSVGNGISGVNITITDTSGCQSVHVIPPGVMDWVISQPLSYTHAPAYQQAKSADELNDGDLILTLISRGYAVWKPPHPSDNRS